MESEKQKELLDNLKRIAEKRLKMSKSGYDNSMELNLSNCNIGALSTENLSELIDHIQKIVPTGVTEFKLDLSNNDISKLPDNFKEWNCLTCLLINNNPKLKEIPYIFSKKKPFWGLSARQCTELEKVGNFNYLNEDQVSYLQFLDLSGCKLSVWPRITTEYREFQVGNAVNERVVLDRFKGLEHLRVLDISNNKFKGEFPMSDEVKRLMAEGLKETNMEMIYPEASYKLHVKSSVPDRFDNAHPVPWNLVHTLSHLNVAGNELDTETLNLFRSYYSNGYKGTEDYHGGLKLFEDTHAFGPFADLDILHKTTIPTTGDEKYDAGIVVPSQYDLISKAGAKVFSTQMEINKLLVRNKEIIDTLEELTTKLTEFKNFHEKLEEPNNAALAAIEEYLVDIKRIETRIKAETSKNICEVFLKILDGIPKGYYGELTANFTIRQCLNNLRKQLDLVDEEAYERLLGAIPDALLKIPEVTSDLSTENQYVECKKIVDESKEALRQSIDQDYNIYKDFPSVENMSVESRKMFEKSISGAKLIDSELLKWESMFYNTNIQPLVIQKLEDELVSITCKRLELESTTEESMKEILLKIDEHREEYIRTFLKEILNDSNQRERYILNTFYEIRDTYNKQGNSNSDPGTDYGNSQNKGLNALSTPPVKRIKKGPLPLFSPLRRPSINATRKQSVRGI